MNAFTPATYASTSDAASAAAVPRRTGPPAPNPTVRRKRSWEWSRRRRPRTASRARSAAGTPSARAGPGRGRSQDRRTHPAWPTRRCVGDAVRVANDLDRSERPSTSNRAAHRQAASERARRDTPSGHHCYDDDENKGRRRSVSLLKTTLDRLYAEFNYPDSATDPIQIVRRFERPTIARSSGSARRRSRSAASPACCSRSSGCSR